MVNVCHVCPSVSLFPLLMSVPARRGVAVTGQVQLRRLPLSELVHEGEDDVLVVARRTRVGQGRLAVVLPPVDGDAAGMACIQERHKEGGNDQEDSGSSACHGFSVHRY
jgi:hypothetical protein